MSWLFAVNVLSQVFPTDGVLFLSSDVIPGIADEQIVNAPVLEGQRCHFHDIHQFFRLDDQVEIFRNGGEVSLFWGTIHATIISQNHFM